SFSQNKMSGRVIDSETNLPIQNAEIVDVSSNSPLLTNKAGSFKVSNSGSYIIKKEGYFALELYISVKDYIIVQLRKTPSLLEEIVVNANHLPRNLSWETAAVSLISQENIELANNTEFAPILNRVPGVFMQNGALNTNRITIRGIGARNLFGTSKIRAYFKDIPLTNGSGETILEDFELESIASMEIIKGATSSSYGAGLGGTVILKPQNAYLKSSNALTELQIGSFGLLKTTTNINLGFDRNSFRVVYSNTNSDGFRDNNNYNRQTFTINSNHYLNENNDISIFGSFVDLKAFIPSSLSAEDFNNNPEQAAFNWASARGFEDSKRGLLGVTWNHNYKYNLKQIISVFTSIRENFEPRPFNVLDENSLAFGIRSRLIGNTKLFNKNFNFVLGGEFFQDYYKNKTFENLYQDFPPGTGSISGERLSDFKERRMYYNFFAEADYDVSEKTLVSIGLNMNQTNYKLDDRFPVSENNSDQSGDFRFNAILSPKFGISHQFTESISFFSSISHGFSPISLNETLLPDGQINTELKPETGWNFEIGSRGRLFKDKLVYSASIYRLNISNLVVSRRTAQDEFIGINAGKTRHDGLELQLDYHLISKKQFNIEPFLTYTLNNFRFDEFIDGNDDFSGNDLTGVPDQILNIGASFSTKYGLYGNINHQYVGQMPITDSNSLYSESYTLTNIKIGFKRHLADALSFNVFFGLNNIFDEKYASQILINANSFGGQPPRYFYPGNPVNYFSGIRLNYDF
ncbi:MAG: TonB-dependent receptor, partial [Bacteroidota bacterium]